MTPVEILTTRFVLGYVLLWVLWPKRLRQTTLKQEGVFAAAGLTGVCGYYLLENVALVYTRASNVSVIVCLAPFFTLLLERIFFKRTPLAKSFVFGLVLSLVGVGLISWSGQDGVQFNFTGDLLAAAAALVWALYCVLIKKISEADFEVLPATRRTFFYGIVLTVPCAFVMDVTGTPMQWMAPVNVLNLAFLGFLASGLCFVWWARSVAALGAVISSLYIYLVPVVTVLVAAVVLDEPLTVSVMCGVALVVAGQFVSQKSALTFKRRQ